MNLHSAVIGAINAVNPSISATLKVSTGDTIADDGAPTPTYAADATIQVQVQALTYKDIQQIDGLNLNGTRRAIYAYGDIEGLVRATNKGGDLITIASGVHAGTWLVAMVLETWGDGLPAAWCKVAVTLQNGA